MRKQVLVSVDRGETRVALMEATGAPAAAAKSGGTAAAPLAPGAKAKSGSDRLARRGALPRAPRQPLDRRQHLQGQGRQRPARAGGGVRRHRPRQERLPARRRDRHARRRGRPPRPRRRRKGKSIGELLKPGQEVVVQVVKDPLKTKGARLSMDLTIAGRYMVYTPDRRGRRRLQAPRRQGARPPAPRGQGARPATAAARSSAPRPTAPSAPGLRARAAVPVQAPRGPRQARRRDRRARDGLPGGRPVGARRARHLQRPTSRRRSSTTSSSTTASSRSSRAPRPSWSTASSCGRSPSRCSRRCGRREGHRRPDVQAGRPAQRRLPADRLRRGADGHRRQLRLVRRPRQAGAPGGHDHAHQPRGGRRGRPASCGCATSAGSSSSTSSTWRAPGTATRCSKTLRKALDEDRTKTFTAEISKLGLVEMTRQNVTEGVREIMSRPCPTCHGEGVIKSEETIAIEFERQLREIASRAPSAAPRRSWSRSTRACRRSSPARARACCTRWRPRPARSSTSRAPRACRWTTSRSPRRAPREDIEERAIPFKEGDEVLVHIVEPHMYEVDDAVAKIDGYIISVVNGGRFVGRRSSCASRRPGGRPRSRRCWTTARTRRRRDGESLESKPRRRGRRGGRRRSAAKAEATSE